MASQRKIYQWGKTEDWYNHPVLVSQRKLLNSASWVTAREMEQDIMADPNTPKTEVVWREKSKGFFHTSVACPVCKRANNMHTNSRKASMFSCWCCHAHYIAYESPLNKLSSRFQ